MLRAQSQQEVKQQTKHGMRQLTQRTQTTQCNPEAKAASLPCCGSESTVTPALPGRGVCGQHSLALLRGRRHHGARPGCPSSTPSPAADEVTFARSFLDLFCSPCEPCPPPALGHSTRPGDASQSAAAEGATRSPGFWRSALLCQNVLKTVYPTTHHPFQ